ncbi:hypothetical protein UB46_39620 [Burkholderiaceae bacterium 16]|nr:hypothetical protein UB46_39620 [Burkholderiaceae bacterium 16]
MADPKTPFGLRLLGKRLRLPVLEQRGVSDRGTTDRFGAVSRFGDRSGAGAGASKYSPEGFAGQYSGSLESPKSIARINRDLSLARIQATFSHFMPANVEAGDAAASDALFRDRRLASVVKRVAEEFRVNAALLAEHLAAEVHKFKEEYSEIPKGIGIEEWVRGKTLTTSDAGLDDWVRERHKIERFVPEAKRIPAGVFSDPIPAESVARKFQKLRQPVPPSLMKPQRRFSLYDGMRASAAYLKYKERLVRYGVGNNNFEELPREVQFQLARLAVNPTRIGEGSGEVGLQHWIRVTRRGQLEELFDFRPVSSKETGDRTVQDVVRRATIHTVRAMHLAESIFAE